MATHYDVLGVRTGATAAQIRRAYVDKARQLHPDGYGGRPQEEIDGARRAMQDVNEAWRVLREPERRAAYDRSLRAVPTPSRHRPAAHGPAAPRPADDWLDRPFPRHAAEPGDLTVAVVRAAPWVAVLLVLATIFVFTAFARGGEAPETVIGRCVRIDAGRPERVPCAEPNDGRVVGIVDQPASCTNGSVATALSGGGYYCLRAADAG